jgi:hypothetical protein
MTGSQRRKSSYGESLIGTWVLIIAASAIVVGLGLNGGAAVLVAFALVIGFAVATSAKKRGRS